jgi:RNA polymerase sigma factor (sigma-70 family)
MSRQTAGTSPALQDAALVARCRAGDSAAWNELVDRFARYVYAIAVQGFRLGQQDAEDVFQDVFAKVYEHLGRLRDDSAIRPWIGQLTRRTCVDRLRAGARETPLEDIEPPGIDDLLATLDEALTVREALETLSEPCRDILDRFFARDESYRVIGDALALPPGTIASRISRCLEKLKGAMEETADASRPMSGDSSEPV